MSSYDAAKARLTEVKTAMLLHVPFFASLMFDQMSIKVGKFPEVFGENTPTGATDGQTIWLDEDFFAKLKLTEAVFLMCHEIGHAMFQHMSRAKNHETTGFDGKEFSHDKWNKAADYVINDMLQSAQIGTVIDGALLDSKYNHTDWMADDVYRDLPDPPPGGGGGGGQGGGQAGNGQGQGPLDTHVPATSKVSQAEWKRAIQSAADRAKAQGNMPDNLKRIVDQLVNPKVPWQELLRTIVMRAASRDAHTWAKPHRRRLITQGVVLPSYTGFGAGDIVVAIDTSGSIGEHELTAFLSETQNILDVARPSRVWVVPCDAKVHEVTELAVEDDLLANQPPLGGGGGTAFEPVFDWVDEEGIVPSALIYLTDMYGSFPENPPAYKTIWCSTSEDMEAPFGETIHIDIGEDNG